MNSSLRCVILALFIVLPFVIRAQNIAVKTNGLYWLAVTPNIGMEFATADRWSMEVTGCYNPFQFDDEKKLKYWFAQPELKYWLRETFKGHFIALQVHGGQFYSTLADRRRDGYLLGGGIGYGYDWQLSSHWILEAEAAVGYVRFQYKEAECLPCIRKWEYRHFNYVGLTRLALSAIYRF